MMNFKYLAYSNLSSVLLLALFLGACANSTTGDDTSGDSNATATPTPEATVEIDDPEAAAGTYNLKMKTGDEIIATMRTLTGINDNPGVSNFNGGNGENLSEYINSARSGLPLTSDPANFNAPAAKEIFGLATAFCQEATIENNRRRELFPQESMFYQNLDTSDFIILMNNFGTADEPGFFDSIYDIYADAYLPGNVALKEAGQELEFVASSKEEIRELVYELGSDRQGATEVQMLRVMMVTTCASILGSGYNYLY